MTIQLTDFGKAVLKDRYLDKGEDYEDLFKRVARAYASDNAHYERLHSYLCNLWFMPATPILSNGGTTRGLPISCFLNEVNDSLEGIVETWNENVWLAARGGGIGTYWGNLRSIGESVGCVGYTSGIIPFIKVMDSQTLAISQGSLRRGSAAVYLDISHPEIEEFIDIRRPTGGDPNRKALNLHHGIMITDDFMKAVLEDGQWELKSPKDGNVVEKLSARALWIKMLVARLETGEPYMVFKDRVTEAMPWYQKKAGLSVNTSNLCSEITLPTNEERTAVCCLASLNLEKWNEWHNDKDFIFDVMVFLDNVLQDFIDRAPDTMSRAVFSAIRDRSVGLGVMGFHSFLQQNMVPFEGVMAKTWNKVIFQHIKKETDEASKALAKLRGPCPDAKDYGVEERFACKTAIAPTANISVICGGTSPGIEPIVANAFTHKTLSGSFAVKNKYLKDLLGRKGHDDSDTWKSIVTNGGSVQHLDYLSDDEKAVFRTAFELDQRWIIEHASDRTPYIDQSQSVNLFIPADIHKKDLHGLHVMAWEKGLKSLYYCRSMSLQRAESDERIVDYDECLSCQ
jgi:ribonucleoside-diphosphate reductase alpha chain